MRMEITILAILNHILRQPLIIPNSSLPRRRESSYVESLWIPAFAGMTFLEVALNLTDTDKNSLWDELNIRKRE
jgi:hypothetical protein